MFDAYWWCRSNLVTGLGGGRGGPMKHALSSVGISVFLFLSMWSSVRMSDGFRLKALGILLGSMRYGVACGSHCIVLQVVASCTVYVSLMMVLMSRNM